MKTLDWSVETLGLDYNSTGLCNNLFKRVSETSSATYLHFDIWLSNITRLFLFQSHIIERLIYKINYISILVYTVGHANLCGEHDDSISILAAK